MLPMPLVNIVILAKVKLFIKEDWKKDQLLNQDKISDNQTMVPPKWWIKAILKVSWASKM